MNISHYYKRLVPALLAISCGMILLLSTTVYAAAPKKVENVRVTKEFLKAVVIAFDKVSGADGYQIVICDKTGKILNTINSTSSNIMINGLEPSGVYYIKVRSYVVKNGKKTFSVYSDTLTAITVPAAISGIKYISNSETSAGMSWDKQNGVTGYYIYKYDDDNARWKLKTITGTNSFVDNSLEPATEYLYKIYGYIRYGSKVLYGAETEVGLTSAPEDVENLLCSYVSADALMFEWSSALYASGYQVNLYEKGGSRVRSVDQKETQIRFEDLDFNKQYYVIIRAYRLFDKGKKCFSGYAVCNAGTRIARVDGIVQTTVAKDSATITYNTVGHASEYGIYSYDPESGKTKLIGTSTKGEYTIKDLKPNTFAYYKVMARYIENEKTYYGIMSDEFRINTDLSGITEYRITAYTEEGFTVAYDPVSNAYEYKAYYKDPDTGKYKLFATTDKTRIVFTGLKDATYYDFTVQAFLRFGNETFSTQKTVSRATTAPKAVKLNGGFSSENEYKVSWTPSSGQTGYDVWKYSDSKAAWVKLGTTADTYYIYKVTEGEDSLRFKVRPYIKTDTGYACGAFSDVIEDPAGKIGIDVSSHQSTIDWKKVKAAGVSYAIIRIGYRGYTYGTIKMDDQFENNIKGALENGIDVGIYFFSTSISKAEAREEANWVLEHIKGYNVTYPIVFDYEGYENPDYRSYKQSKKNRTDYAIAFLDVIRENGYIPMMYGSQYYYNNEWETDRLAEKYSLWCAKYPTNSGGVQINTPDLTRQPNIPWAYAIWQYSSIGKVSGISTVVDMNYQYTWFKL